MATDTIDDTLFGLSADETREFRHLSKHIPRLRDENIARVRDARWIELFLKHETAKVGQLQ